MVFGSKQKKQVQDAKAAQAKLLEDHQILTEELKAAKTLQAELERESVESELKLEKAQETRVELQEVKKEALEALAEERKLLEKAESEYGDRLKADAKTFDADMAQVRDKEDRAKAGIAALEAESKSLIDEEQRLRTEIEKHKGELQAIESDSGTTANINFSDPLINAAATDDEKLKMIREEKTKVESSHQENEKILASLQTAIESANLATKAAEARQAEVAVELEEEKARAARLQANDSMNNPKQQFEDLQRQNDILSEEIAAREKDIEQSRNALKVANQNADALEYEMQRTIDPDLAKAEAELKTVTAQAVVAREEAEIAEKERTILADEVATAKAQLEERQNDLSADHAKWKNLLDDSKKKYAEAEERLRAAVEDKAWHDENLRKLTASYTESSKQTDEVLKELQTAQKKYDELPDELKEIKYQREKAKQEESACQKEHDSSVLQARFHRVMVEAQLKDHEDLFNGATSIPQALESWRSAQNQIEDELRNAKIEREGLLGQIAGLEPVLAAANNIHQDRVKALEQIQKDCDSLREDQKAAALQEKAAATKLSDAKIAYEAEETELRHNLQMAKAKLFEARQEHRQLKGDLNTAKGRLSVKANSYMQHREACADTVDALVKTKRDTEMVYWLHGDEPRDLVHMAMSTTPRSQTSKLAGAGSSIFK